MLNVTQNFYNSVYALYKKQEEEFMEIEIEEAVRNKENEMFDSIREFMPGTESFKDLTHCSMSDLETIFDKDYLPDAKSHPLNKQY